MAGLRKRYAPSTFDAWSAALRVAAELERRRDVFGVAVTGSLARGDFVAGSDVDLWVLGPKDAREERMVGGVAVSLLWLELKRAKTPEALLRFEVDDAVVLNDVGGHFARLKDTSHQRRAELVSFAAHAAALSMHLVVTRAQAAPPELAVASLREVARRGAALVVFMERGWRVPRLRHFLRALRPPHFHRLIELLALPRDVRPLLPLLRRALRDAPAVRELPLPELTLVRRYLDHGRHGDAVVAIRQGLPPGPDDPSAAMSEAQQALFRAVHGFAKAPPRRAAVARLARQVLALLGSLGVFRLTAGHAPLERSLRRWAGA
ncbi:MAG: nucleotidyltransferase family protein [Myxococcota bacterium]